MIINNCDDSQYEKFDPQIFHGARQTLHLTTSGRLSTILDISIVFLLFCREEEEEKKEDDDDDDLEADEEPDDIDDDEDADDNEKAENKSQSTKRVKSKPGNI